LKALPYPVITEEEEMKIDDKQTPSETVVVTP
jgi:hypothetical protein